MGDSKDSLPSGNGLGPVALKVMAQVADACLCLPASYYAGSMVDGRATAYLAVVPMRRHVQQVPQ